MAIIDWIYDNMCSMFWQREEPADAVEVSSDEEESNTSAEESESESSADECENESSTDEGDSEISDDETVSSQNSDGTQHANRPRWQPSTRTLQTYRRQIMKHQCKPTPWIAQGARIGKREPIIHTFSPDVATLKQGPRWYFGTSWYCGGRFNDSMVAPILGISHVASRSRVVQKLGDPFPLAEPVCHDPGLAWPAPIPVIVVEKSQSVYHRPGPLSTMPLPTNPALLTVPTAVTSHGCPLGPARPALSAVTAESNPSIQTAMPVPTSRTAATGHDMLNGGANVSSAVENVNVVPQSHQVAVTIPGEEPAAFEPQLEVSRPRTPVITLGNPAESASLQPLASPHPMHTMAITTVVAPPISLVSDLSSNGPIMPAQSLPFTASTRTAPAQRNSAMRKGPRNLLAQSPDPRSFEDPTNPLLALAKWNDPDNRIKARGLMTDWIEDLIDGAKYRFPPSYSADMLGDKAVHEFCVKVYKRFKDMHTYVTYGDSDEAWNEKKLPAKYVKLIGLRKGESLTVLGKKLKDAAKISPVGDVAEACRAFEEFDELFKNVAPSL